MLNTKYVAAAKAGGTHKIELEFTDDVHELLTYAARADGWRSQITDENGIPIDNPETAIGRAMYIAMNMLFNQAIVALSSERAEEARRQAIDEVQTMKDLLMGKGS